MCRRKARVLIVAVLAVLVPARAVLLVDGGRPNCTIVIAATADPGVRAAATDLQYHLREMSGAEVAIVDDAARAVGVKLWVGVVPPGFVAPAGVDLQDPRAFWPDGYLLAAAEPWGGVLLAPRPEGVTNAVYGLLEDHLGCHWFTPGKIGECIPHRDRVELQIEGGHEVVKPSFEQRSPWYNGNASARLTDAEKQEIARWRTRNRAGGVRGYAGHNWSEIYTKALQEKERELAPVINGVRTPSAGEAQPCLSYPRAAEIGAEYFISLFTRAPELDYYSFSQNDSLVWCQCERCKAYGGSNSERMLKLANAVAERLAQVHPDKRIAILPYAAAIEAPEPALPPRRGVVGVVCSFSMEQLLPKTADNRWTNTFRQRAAGWMRMMGAGWVYDYKGWYPGPWTLFANLQTDHDYYRSIGVSGDMDEYLDRNLGTDVTQWLTFQTGWAADRKVDALLDTFYPAYFGAAAEPLRSVYESFAKQMLSLGSTGEIMDVPRLYPVPLVEGALATIAQAKQRVAGDAVIVARLERDENCLKLTRLFLDFWSAAGALRRSAAPADLKQAVQAGEAYLSLSDSLDGTLTVGKAARQVVATTLSGFQSKGPHFDQAGPFAYSDILDEGGMSFLAKSRTGFRLGTYGLELAPGIRGEIVYEVSAGPGLRFTTVHLERMYLKLPTGGHNAVEVSVDGGKSWRTAFADVNWWGGTEEPDLTPLVEGSNGFLLKFWVQNSADDVLAMDNWGMRGEVK